MNPEDTTYLRRLSSDEFRQFIEILNDRDPAAATAVANQVLEAAGSVDQADAYMAYQPHPRQRDFLKLQVEEVLYGGAAGGGKTLAMLLWLAEGVGIPGFSGLFLRRTYAQLSKGVDSPINLSFDIFGPLGGKYVGHQWRFPTGAIVEFGHMQHEISKENYQGAAYHRVCYDELTQFTLTQYTYLFSRMRRHADFPIACGIRAGSNPGGEGHAWVRDRFVTPEAIDAINAMSTYDTSPPGLVFPITENRSFVPARVPDNPSLDVHDYIERMKRSLPSVLAARLINGDWSVVEDAVIRADWVREYDTEGESIYPLLKNGVRGPLVPHLGTQRFATVDTAGTSKQRLRESRGLSQPSYSVCGIWDYWPKHRLLFLRDLWRARVDWHELRAGVDEICRRWQVDEVGIENAHHGPVLAAELKAAFRVRLLSSATPRMKVHEAGNAKLERAIASGMLSKFEHGEIFLPKDNVTWRADYESELFTFSGLESQTADQVDVTSYACQMVRESTSGNKRLKRARVRQTGGRPFTSAGEPVENVKVGRIQTGNRGWRSKEVWQRGGK